MVLWAVLQFAFALTTTISGIALIISKMHVIERAEEQEFWRELKEKVASS